jgi:signal peptidase I
MNTSRHTSGKHASHAAGQAPIAAGPVPAAAADPTEQPSPKRPEPSHPLLRDIGALLVKVAVIAAMFVALFTFVFGFFRYDDVSMKPSVKSGDAVLYYRLDRDYIAEDVCVFTYQDKLTCGRVVAVAGDTVDIRDNQLLVNGSYQQETDIYSDTTQFENGPEMPLTVPEGSVFVLGDNRSTATDSRIIGCISTDDTQGTVIAIVRRRGI